MKLDLLSAMAAAAVMAVGLASCSDDGPTPGHTPGTPVTRDNDILRSRIVHSIDISDLDAGALELNGTDDVEITVASDSPVRFRLDTRDGRRCLVPELVAQFSGIRVTSMKISPKGEPERARNVVVTLQGSPAGRATDGALHSVYSQYIGKGTRCWARIGNTTKAVMLYDRISQLDENYLTVNSTLNIENMVELCGSNYEECMESLSVNVGASFKKIRHKEAVDDSGPFPVFHAETRSISGNFNFDFEGSLKQSADFEYYLNMYFVRKAEVALDMARFEMSDNNTAPDSLIFALTAGSFIEQLTVDSEKFDTEEFFDEWGTDVITTGVFGGYCLNLYGREENVYDSSLGIDASESIKMSRPNSEGKDWVYIYNMKNSPYIDESVDVGWHEEHYSEASRAVTFYACVGGNMSDNNAEKWIEGFNDASQSDKWALVGYRRLSDTGNVTDSVSNLYPVEFMANDLVDTYRSMFGGRMSQADSLALENAYANVVKLSGAKMDYLERHAHKMTDATPLIVCDIMMKNGANGHKNGDPQPFVAPDPNEPSKYRRYYPMMANRNAPYDEGYAMETTQNDYYVSVSDSEDHYWYYAMAHEDDCYGIVDVQFVPDPPEWYTARGDNAFPGGNGMNITKNRVCVRFADPKASGQKKFTAFGLYNKNDGSFNPDRVMASTAGSELRPNPVQSEYNDWRAFWSSGASYVKTQWNEGTFTQHVKIWPCYSTSPVGNDRVKNAIHPKRWGQ